MKSIAMLLWVINYNCAIHFRYSVAAQLKRDENTYTHTNQCDGGPCDRFLRQQLFKRRTSHESGAVQWEKESKYNHIIIALPWLWQPRRYLSPVGGPKDGRVNKPSSLLAELAHDPPPAPRIEPNRGSSIGEDNIDKC